MDWRDILKDSLVPRRALQKEERTKPKPGNKMLAVKMLSIVKNMVICSRTMWKRTAMKKKRRGNAWYIKVLRSLLITVSWWTTAGDKDFLSHTPMHAQVHGHTEKHTPRREGQAEFKKKKKKQIFEDFHRSQYLLRSGMLFTSRQFIFTCLYLLQYVNKGT